MAEQESEQESEPTWASSARAKLEPQGTPDAGAAGDGKGALDTGVLADARRLSESLAKHRRQSQMLRDELFKSFKDMESQRKKKGIRSWAEIEADMLAEEEGLFTCESEMALVPGRLLLGQPKQALHLPCSFDAATVLPPSGFSARLTSIFPSPGGPVALQCAAWSRTIAKRHRSVSVSPGVLAERILLDGHTLSSVLQEFKGKDVLVYQEEDFVDTQLDQLCKGRPVFAKMGTPVEEETLTPNTRDWAKHTARVLESELPLEPLCDLIRSGNLRFLGQVLEQALEGARLAIQRLSTGGPVMVFEEEDFEGVRCLRPELRELMLGRPVFLPEKGCDFVLALPMMTDTGSDAPGHRLWPNVLVYLAHAVPELADGMLSGSIPLDGRLWTDIQLRPLPVWDEEPTGRHLFPTRQEWQASYTARPMITVADFPDLASMPDWVASKVSGTDYLAHLRRVAVSPCIAGGIPLRGRHRFNYPHPGFYNLKHYMLDQYMVGLSVDDPMD